MKLIDAMERVLTLAGKEFGSDGQAPGTDETAASRQSILEMEDFVVNHWEGLEDRYDDQFDADAAASQSLDPFWALKPQTPLENAIFTSLELAARQVASEPNPSVEDRRAVSMLANFWLTHGKDVTSSLTQFDLGSPS